MSVDFNKKRVWGPVPNYPHVADGKTIFYWPPIVIAGPCSVESAEQMDTVARCLSMHKRQNIYLRGGVYSGVGTYPSAAGQAPRLDRARLSFLHHAAKKHELKCIVEVMDVRDAEEIAPWVDAFQVGARHMQDYVMLHELTMLGKTVTLKRNMGATLDEFLGAAEYLVRSKTPTILIERGSATHMNHVRWDLSISLIPAIKRISSIPIIVDASHGTGRRDLVMPMTLAGIAAGADGFLVEVHPQPEQSRTDTDQAFPLLEFPSLLTRALEVHKAACPAEQI